MKMNPKVKRLWVSALRSGKYKQGRSRLNRWNKEFCCLGVLCELAVEAGVTQRHNDYDNYSYGSRADNAFGAYHLPRKVMRWAGLPKTEGAIVTIDHNAKSLVEHNDRGKTFKSIAKAIEEQL